MLGAGHVTTCQTTDGDELVLESDIDVSTRTIGVIGEQLSSAPPRAQAECRPSCVAAAMQP